MIVDKEFKHLLDGCWIDKHLGYVWKYVGTRSAKKLHRIIMAISLGRDLKDNEYIDHINGIRHDNRLCNLRIANPSQNMMNQTRPGKGIRITKEGNWQARIQFNKKSFCLGTFENRKDAVNSYNEASRRLHGQFGQPTS